jgi:hypothetical protein
MSVPQRCSRCILPATSPIVELDDTGVCNYCRNFEKACPPIDDQTRKSLESQLEARLSKAKRKAKTYDCLVPVSGGKDSMYALYVCVKKLNLNVLAYNFDNGFQSEEAAQNIDNAVRVLGVDFIKVKPSETLLFELFRTFLLKTGSFCAPCNLIISEAALRIAKQNKISTIVSGNSPRWSAAFRGMSISKYANLPFYYNVIDGSVPAAATRNIIRTTETYDAIARKLGYGVQVIDLFKYYNPMKNAILDTIKAEIGWVPPSEGLEHGDCLVNPVKDHLVCRKWGFSEVSGGYATLVRNGKISREEALAKAESEEAKDPPAVLELFLERIGVAREAFEQAATERHFTQYSNEHGALFSLAKKVTGRAR